MSTSVKAIIKPEILVWARKAAGYKNLDAAAKKINVKPEQLAAWESGTDSPTVIQLRKVASVYKRPIVVFYLPTPPKGVDVLHDFRTLPGDTAGDYSPDLTYEIRKAYHRRERALELYEDLGEKPIPVSFTASLTDDTDKVADKIREYLGITRQNQESWKTPYDALNGWKSAFEARDILVFQASKIDVAEMRGFSIASQPAPVIVLNAADAPFARVFTLLHELTHIALSIDGVCTMDSKKDKVEVFCNAVAGAALLPSSWISTLSSAWDDANVRAASKRFGISNQVVIRRLLTLGKISQAEYTARKAIYEREANELAAKKTENIPVSQSTKAISSAGKLFTKLVLESYHRQKVTGSDVSDLLSVRLQHLKDIEAKVYG